MKPKTIFILSIFLFGSIYSFAQKDGFNSHISQTDSPHHAFSVKAKLWIWPVFMTAIQLGAGAEYGFKDRYAISAEAEFSFYNFPNDGGSDSVGPRLNTNFGGIILTFKKYYMVRGSALYLGVFGRYGVKSITFDAGYITDTTSWNQYQYSLGMVVGGIIPIGKRLSIDFNLGPFYKEKYTHSVYTQNGSIVDIHNHSGNFGLRLSCDFSFGFPKKSRHLMQHNQPYY